MSNLKLFISHPKAIDNPFNNKPFETSIKKQSCSELEVSCDGLKDNTVHNLKFHGGPDRVLHYFPKEHYEYFKTRYPDKKDLFISGSIGENISGLGWLESNVHIGDQFKVGDVILEVTEPRKPCGAIDITYGERGIFKLISETIKCGWFFRVIQPGKINENDKLERIRMGNQLFNLKDVYLKSVNDKSDKRYLTELANEKTLSTRWRERVEIILNSK